MNAKSYRPAHGGFPGTVRIGERHEKKVRARALVIAEVNRYYRRPLSRRLPGMSRSGPC